jgi:hypothetical protein
MRRQQTTGCDPTHHLRVHPSLRSRLLSIVSGGIALAAGLTTGDHRATQLLINMMQLSENRPDAAEAAAPAEADHETMQHVIARMRRMARQGNDGNTDAN